MTTFLAKLRLGNQPREAAERAQPMHRLARWIALGARRDEFDAPSFEKELCESARRMFARHQTFYLYASAAEDRYRAEALEFLSMVVAYFNGKAGKLWNADAVRYSALDLLDTLERRPETFASLSQRLVDQMRREVRDYVTTHCLDLPAP